MTCTIFFFRRHSNVFVMYFFFHKGLPFSFYCNSVIIMSITLFQFVHRLKLVKHFSQCNELICNIIASTIKAKTFSLNFTKMSRVEVRADLFSKSIKLVSLPDFLRSFFIFKIGNEPKNQTQTCLIYFCLCFLIFMMLPQNSDSQNFSMKSFFRKKIWFKFKLKDLFLVGIFCLVNFCYSIFGQI